VVVVRELVVLVVWVKLVTMELRVLFHLFQLSLAVAAVAVRLNHVQGKAVEVVVVAQTLTLVLLVVQALRMKVLQVAQAVTVLQVLVAVLEQSVLTPALALVAQVVLA
jgi:hypothetical protein